MTSLSSIKTMSDAQIQAWLRRVGKANAPSLVMALLGADEEVHACVFRNLSLHAAAQIRKDLDAQRAKGVHAALVARCTEEMEKLLP
jgi:flagellar motor switch protein FliG